MAKKETEAELLIARLMRPMTKEQKKSFVPLTDEEVDEVLAEGRRIRLQATSAVPTAEPGTELRYCS